MTNGEDDTNLEGLIFKERLRSEEGDTSSKQHTSTKTTESGSAILAVTAQERVHPNDHHNIHTKTMNSSYHCFQALPIFPPHGSSSRHSATKCWTSEVGWATNGPNRQREEPCEHVYSMPSDTPFLSATRLIKPSLDHHLHGNGTPCMLRACQATQKNEASGLDLSVYESKELVNDHC